MKYNIQSYEFLDDVWPLFDGTWPLLAGFTTFFIFLILLDVILKAVALWKAARADQMGWFIFLIVFNTVGILPIIYLLFFTRKTKGKTIAEPVIKIAPKLKKRAKR